jgi:hypothetical protein
LLHNTEKLTNCRGIPQPTIVPTEAIHYDWRRCSAADADSVSTDFIFLASGLGASDRARGISFESRFAPARIGSNKTIIPEVSIASLGDVAILASPVS